MKYTIILIIAYLFLCTHSSPLLAQKLDIASAPSLLVNVPYSAVAALPQSPAPQTLKYGQDPEQYILHWPAAEVVTPSAPVIMIHGGCWLSAFDISHSIAQANGLANAGHAVYSLEYRRTGHTGGGWPITLTDVMTGITTIINELPHNTTTINLLGHSAGGHLALLAAGDIQRHLTRAQRHDIKVNVVGLAAIVDIKQYALGDNSCQAVTSDFMGGEPVDKAIDYYLANPLNLALTDAAISQVSLLQGDADTIVPKTQAIHPNATTLIVPGAGHFDWIHPHSLAFQTLLGVLQ